jgi:hypothetical protein
LLDAAPLAADQRAHARRSSAGPDDGGGQPAKARRSLHLRNFTHIDGLGPEFAAV